MSPEKVDPIGILQKMVQMYEGELQNVGIKTELVVDQSLNDMAVGQVIIDPSRLLQVSSDSLSTTRLNWQVLINIFTNAIKFTKNSSRRQITLTLSSSYSRPALGPHGGSYVPFRTLLTTESDNGESSPDMESSMDTVYLQFAVEDTGQGLSPEEMGALFQRFSQASPKTYGKYGYI
jgi:signal transduction histidine kinase